MNLDKVRQLAAAYTDLSGKQKEQISQQITTLLTRLEQEPKPVTWRLRARVGDRLKWYKEVDEVK
jgi:hypothetical protein